MLFGKHAKKSFCFLLLLLAHFTGSSAAHFSSQVIYESASHLANEGDFAIVDREGKLGIVDAKGATIVPAAYRKIRINQDNSVSVLPFSEWMVLDGKDQFSHKLEFDEVAPLATGLLRVTLGDKEALADSQGHLLTEMVEWEISPFQGNYGVVKKNGQYGILNAGGKITIPIAYDTLILNEDYVIGGIKKERKQPLWKVFQYSGELLFKKECEAMDHGNQGYFAFKENNSWGFLNYKGEKAVLNQYDQVQPFIDGRAIARYLESDGVINRKGEWLIRPRKDHLQHLQDDIYLFRSVGESGLISASAGELFKTTYEFIGLNHGFLEKKDNGKMGLISPEGKRLLITAYDEISELQNDTVYFYKKDDHWGIVTKEGKIKLNADNPIQEMYPMGDIFIGVKIDDKYGFIDINGDLRIANRYDAIGSFHEGKVAVKLLGKWGFVDRIERLFVQPLYDRVFPFENNTAIVEKKGKYGLVNDAGEDVLSTSYDSLYRTSSGRFISQRGTTKGLVSKSGKVLIHPKYDEINDLDNGYILIKRNDKFGLLTKNGVSTIPLIYDQLVYNPYDQVYYATKQPHWKGLEVDLEKKKR